MADQSSDGHGQGQSEYHRPQNVKEAYAQTTALHNKIFSEANLSVARSQLNRCLAASPEYQNASWGLLGRLFSADLHFRRETTRSIAKHQVLAARSLTDREVNALMYIHDRGTRGYIFGEGMIDGTCAIGALSGAWPLPRAWLNGMMSQKVLSSTFARTMTWMIPVSMMLAPYKTWRERSEMMSAQSEKMDDLKQLSDDVGSHRKGVIAGAVQQQEYQHQHQGQDQGQAQGQTDSTADWGSASFSAQREEQASSPQAQPATSYKSGWFGRGSSSSQTQTSYDASPTSESWEPAALPTNKNWENESSSSAWDAPIFDDGQSPVASQSRPQYNNTSSSSSSSGQATSWAQLRAQAGNKSGSATRQAPAGDSSWGNAQGSSSGYSDSSWAAGTGDGQTSWEKQKAQKEFDAMIERERGVDQSASGRILR